MNSQPVRSSPPRPTILCIGRSLAEVPVGRVGPGGRSGSAKGERKGSKTRTSNRLQGLIATNAPSFPDRPPFDSIAPRAALRDREILLARHRAVLRSGAAIVLAGSLALFLAALIGRSPTAPVDEVGTPQIEAVFAQPELDPAILVGKGGTGGTGGTGG